MIKFFRKIRYDLMEKNKTGRYLKYTLGEILLVVIGILIALQINNWNETKKNNLIEHNYLKEMIEDFEKNNQKSQEIISNIEKYLPTLIGLLEQSALEKPTISIDSINIAFSQINHMPSYSSTDRVYNNLIGSGDLKLIQDSKLKTILSEYYESLYILNLVQATHESELVESFQPYIIEYLDFQAVNLNRVDDFGIPYPVEKSKIMEVFGNRKFRNIITLKWTILTDLLEQNRNLEKLNVEMINRLKELTIGHD
jgi:Family of unknown function (DUF6090)